MVPFYQGQVTQAIELGTGMFTLFIVLRARHSSLVLCRSASPVTIGRVEVFPTIPPHNATYFDFYSSDQRIGGASYPRPVNSQISREFWVFSRFFVIVTSRDKFSPWQE